MLRIDFALYVTLGTVHTVMYSMSIVAHCWLMLHFDVTTKRGNDCCTVQVCASPSHCASVGADKGRVGIKQVRDHLNRVSWLNLARGSVG